MIFSQVYTLVLAATTSAIVVSAAPAPQYWGGYGAGWGAGQGAGVGKKFIEWRA